ncbi:MAG: hypothetical protein ACOYXB_10370 [Bacteroidota bacterium]
MPERNLFKRMSGIRIILGILILSPFIPVNGININKLAVPFITNYNGSDYHANTQNWSVAQDGNNIMWFGNTASLIWYDGNEWGKLFIPNNSVVRSVAVLSDNTILAGAFGEFGSVEQDSFGNYTYNSWVDKIPPVYRDFADVWRILELNSDVFIQTPERVFIFSDGKFIKTLEPEDAFLFCFVHRGHFYIGDRSAGLKRLVNGELQLAEDGAFFSGKEIWFVGQSNSQLLIGTQKNGLFILDKGKWKPWNTPVSAYLEKNSLYSGIQKINGSFIFGTIRNGIVFADENGQITQVINRDKGLQNNTVLSMTLDREDNLWLGLDIGISHLRINSPFYHLARNRGLGTGYSSIVFRDRLYLGTNQGVFTYSEQQDDFVILKNSEGQVWSFFSTGDDLLCAHHNGLFRVRENQLEQLLDVQGCWKVMPVPDRPGYFIVGTYTGLWILKKTAAGYETYKIRGFEESCRVMEFDDNNDIWMSHGYKGVYKIVLNRELTAVSSVLFFGSGQGLPADINNELFKADTKIIIATAGGFYHYNDVTGKMEPYPSWNRVLSFPQPVSKVIEDPWGRINFFCDGVLSSAVIMNDSLLFYDNKTFLPIRNNFIPAFENITFLSKNMALIGTEDGFVLYQRDNLLSRGIQLPLNIREVSCGTEVTGNPMTDPVEFMNSQVEIPYRTNNLVVEFSTPYFLSPENLSCQYRLNGQLFHLPQGQRKIFLSNLRENNYELIIEVSDITDFNFPSSVSFRFSVAPPFYRTWYAYVTYIVVLTLIVITTVIVSRKNIERIKRKEKILQQRKMIQHQIAIKQQAERAEKEVVRLRNEKLRNEMKHKNKELANATYHIIQQNKLLNSLKQELSRLSSQATSEMVKSELKRISRQIDKDIKKEKNWEVFDRYFDEVHQEFLGRLRDLHPELTPNELRLSAYLRMNISTKEIAPLMNISVRGVEISRYRLRKKLQLDRDVNLIDYIMQV